MKQSEIKKWLEAQFEDFPRSYEENTQHDTGPRVITETDVLVICVRLQDKINRAQGGE